MVEKNKKSIKLCRACYHVFDDSLRCNNCNSPRIVSHKELLTLKIAHIDCDAFYASIEKNENPSIRTLPVIVGGGRRGVVTTCCYIARIDGVRSAMPMFQAKELCPSAIIVPPRIKYYKKISAAIKERLIQLSPAIEFVSLDEAYIDFTGTQLLHGEPPAVLLARLANEIEAIFGITVSIGLSYNKFLSKISSEREKPRGFSIIGKSDAKDTLKDQSISKIHGIGGKKRIELERKGIRVISDILKYKQAFLKNTLGSFGETLWFLARGIDTRKIIPNELPKSMSCEKTFQNKQIDFDIIRSHLWGLCEQISRRLKNETLVTKRLSLKLKSSNFKLMTKSKTLRNSIDSAEILFQETSVLLKDSMARKPFRLIGINLSDLSKSENLDWPVNLFDHTSKEILSAETAIDNIRLKFGQDAIIKGRSLKKLELD